MKKVVITGGTGLVGKTLTKLLISKGFEVVVLTRNQKLATQFTNFSFWDVDNEIIDEQLINTTDYIIHLAGEGIADKRWSLSRKKQILESRIKPLKLIYKVLQKNPYQLKAIVSASGVGYYGAITSDNIFTEEDVSATDFLGQTCQLWEDEVDKFNTLNVRTVKLRTGIVLTKDGGALKKMALPFKFGFGCAIGSGKQYMPWISLNDLCNMYLFAIDNNHVSGAYNAVIEDETTNLLFSKTLAKSLNKSIWLPNIPSLLLKIVLGEMATLLLEGSRVSNKKITSQGFVFQDVDLSCLLNKTID
ncbi:MAG TPA: TIGR01777 family oxidoreductase [Vicingus sp.]|nr:TIGR01777 family oxidoreductase [Vicingus sp.]HRP60338.1 TIGR01777 family oxidoreductase [Vicingus sp.]